MIHLNVKLRPKICGFIVSDYTAKMSTRISLDSYHKLSIQGGWCANSQNSFRIHFKSFAHVNRATYSASADKHAINSCVLDFQMICASLMAILKPVIDRCGAIPVQDRHPEQLKTLLSWRGRPSWEEPSGVPYEDYNSVGSLAIPWTLKIKSV